MILIQGKGVSKGVMKGSICFYQRAQAVAATGAAGIEEEKRRLEEAKEKSMEQLNALADKARAEAGDDACMQARAAGIKDVPAVLSNDGQSIGLLRFEFLYLASSDYPTEGKQSQAYKEVAAPWEASG